MEKSIVIIPAYNVEKYISKVTQSLKEKCSCAVIFVDDGSTDKTSTIIAKAGYPCISHPKNQGVSKAVLTGLEYAFENGFQKIILMDADGQHPAEFIDDINQALDVYDFVTCSRFYSGNNAPTLKWCSNILGAALVNMIWGTHFTDISCGFKGFHVNDEVLQFIKGDCDYQIVYELLFYALGRRLSIGTIKIPAIYDYSSFLSTRPREILSLLDMIQKYSQGSYSILHELYGQVTRRQNFQIEIGSMHFYSFYLKEQNSYIIQCDPESISKYVNSIMQI